MVSALNSIAQHFTEMYLTGYIRRFFKKIGYMPLNLLFLFSKNNSSLLNLKSNFKRCSYCSVKYRCELRLQRFYTELTF